MMDIPELPKGWAWSDLGVHFDEHKKTVYRTLFENKGTGAAFYIDVPRSGDQQKDLDIRKLCDAVAIRAMKEALKTK